MANKLRGRTFIDKVVTANQGTQYVESKEFRLTNPSGDAHVIIVSALSGGTQYSEIYFSNNDGTGDRYVISSDGTGAMTGYAKAVGGSFLITERYGLSGKVFLPGNAAQTLALAGGSTSASQGATCIYASAITADRAVTLTTTSAFAGLTWRIARLSAATGAFKVNVGVGPLAALDPGEWCEVTYNGSAFVLTAKGSGV